jgi:hypothetical protein
MKAFFIKFLNWITPNFRPLFLLFAAGLFSTALLTQKDKYLVITTHAPKAILSWETNLNNSDRDKMLKDWQITYKNLLVYKNNNVPKITKITGLETVIAQNQADYAFIIFYMGFLLLYISRLVRVDNYNPKWNWLFITLALFTVIGGLLDYVEDFGTSKIVHLYMADATQVLPDASIVGYPSRIKWILLILVVVVIIWQSIILNLALLWLGMISDSLKKGIQLFWRWRVMLFTLLIVFAVLYISDQGQDLLLSLNAKKLGVLLFLFSTSIIALLCWYFPKILEYKGAMNYAEFFFKSVDFEVDQLTQKRPKAEVDISRLLGAAGFLIPAIAILKVMDNYHMDYWFSGIPPLAIFVAILILYRIILEHHWIDKIYKNVNGEINWIKYTITLVLLFIPMIIWGTNKDNEQPYAIIHLSLDLIILSIMFLITVTLRTCSKVIKKWPVTQLVTLTGLACLLFFIACNFPSFLSLFIYRSRFYTMPFVFFAVAGYLLFFTYLMFVGKKTGVTWITILLVIAFIGATSNVTNYHGLAILSDTTHCKTLKGKDTCCKKTADSLTTYAEKWLLGREKEIESYYKLHKKNYPVYFVNAHGGGIRATVWTTMVIGTLDKEMRADTAKANRLGFQHYVFSYSGASGGTVGLMLLTASRHGHLGDLDNDQFFYPDNSLALYSTDNLTSDIIALLGRDLVYSSFGLSGIPDRARLMEMDWEQNARNNGIFLKDSLMSLWRHSKTELPLLFSNTYDIPSGNKGIAAPVLLDQMDFPSAIFLEQEISGRGDMRLSTAGFISARFPYVSPTAKLNTNRHFTDGGTIENSGGETSLQVLNVFERIRAKLIKANHSALNNISINILSLPNSVAGIESPIYDKNFYEPLGPPLGALNVGNANSARAELINSRLQKTKGYTYLPFQPLAYKMVGKAFWPVLPLGWQISNAGLEALEHNAVQNPSPLNAVFNQFGVKRKNQ